MDLIKKLQKLQRLGYTIEQSKDCVKVHYANKNIAEVDSIDSALEIVLERIAQEEKDLSDVKVTPTVSELAFILNNFASEKIESLTFNGQDLDSADMAFWESVESMTQSLTTYDVATK